MRRSRWTRRLIAVPLALALLAPASAPAVTYGRVLVRTVQARSGGLWYAVRVFAPDDRGYYVRARRDFTTDAAVGGAGCMDLSGAPGAQVGGSYALALGGKTSNYQGTVVSPDRAFDSLAPSPIPVPTYSAGEPAGPGRSRATPMSCSSTDRIPKGPYDFLYFIVSSARIDRPKIRFYVDPGVRVLSESWGTGTRFLREWDFAAAVSEGSRTQAIDAAPRTVRTGGMIRGFRDLKFKRHAAVIGSALWPTVGAAIPYSSVLYSVVAPQGDSGATMLKTPDQTAYYPSWIWLLGTHPGTYHIGVEAWAAASAALQGVNPALYLGAADADFPPCSTMRVRARAKDGHPICY